MGGSCYSLGCLGRESDLATPFLKVYLATPFLKVYKKTICTNVHVVFCFCFCFLVFKPFPRMRPCLEAELA